MNCVILHTNKLGWLWGGRWGWTINPNKAHVYRTVALANAACRRINVKYRQPVARYCVKDKAGLIKS